MNKLTKLISMFLVAIGLLILGACNEESNTNNENKEAVDDFPEKDIEGVIPWGEGGATDIISRSLASKTEEEIDGSFVMQNQEGASGATGTQYVYDQPADGYTLLFGAENANLYQTLEISERDYLKDFDPVYFIGQSYGGIVVNKDSEFDTIEDLIEYAQDNPEEVKMGSAGEGSLPHVTSAMLKSELDVEFNQVPYDGDGPLSVALLGDEIDVTVLSTTAAKEYIDSGDFKMLAVMNDEQVDALPDDVPAITDAYEEFETYMPWGPFQGVFAPKDTPENIVDKLSDAFDEAAENEDFKKELEDQAVDPLNLSGNDAIEYLEDNQSTSTWMLYKAGETDTSPEEFDIPKPSEN